MAKITLTPMMDVYVSEYYPDQNFENFGSPEALFISQFEGAGDDYRSLIKFDVCCLVPPTATIKKAELILDTFRNDLTTGSIEAKVYNLLGKWNEKMVTWNNQPPADTTAEDSYTVAAGSLNPVKFDITALVRGWLNGSIPNNGVIVKGDEVKDSLIGFRSTRYEDSAEWPKLEIKLVDGIIKTYPKESLNIPGVGAKVSSSIKLDGRLQASFLIENTGSYDVDARIQVSNDGSTWFNEDNYATLNTSWKDKVVLTTEAAAQYARIIVSTPSSNSSSVDVYPSTREN